MKIWFDTEFIEDGKTIELLSIGAVREDGSAFYAEVTHGRGAGMTDRGRASDWVKANVLPHLRLGQNNTLLRSEIATEFSAWVGPNPEFWAYYADYDWVVLCQLYGRMLDLPPTWPMYCRDLKQLADFYGMPRSAYPPQSEQVHNALVDAQWNQTLDEYISKWRMRSDVM